MAGRFSALDNASAPAKSQDDGLSSPPDAGAVSLRRSMERQGSTVQRCTSLMVEIGHFPRWPRIEIRRP
jgi:hypothetical protein